MDHPSTKVASEASLLCYQQVVAERREGISKAAKFYRARTENGRDQVSIAIEKVNRTAVLGRRAVQPGGDGNVVSDDSDGRAEGGPDGVRIGA